MLKVALVASSVFGDLTRDGLRLAGALVALVLIPVVGIVVIVAILIAAPVAGVGGASGSGDGSQPPPIPPAHRAVMVTVSNETGVPWSLLAAIASVESGFGANMSTSWAGAIGYGQFMPASWAHWGAGDPYDYRDAIPAMARYLLDHNVLHDLPDAVYGYNHSWEYVALVLDRMSYYAASPGSAAAHGAVSGGPP